MKKQKFSIFTHMQQAQFILNFPYPAFNVNGDQTVKKKMPFVNNCISYRFGFMLFNAPFNNISVISWPLVLLVEKTGVPGETTDLSQVTDILIT